ncbi:Gustatory receptor 115c [Halyomorpha halys]|nr:Gustatory receptor 115c [Halyomorpha halys]
MVQVKPCHPTIGKVEKILNDVFKLSRILGTFPIDKEYSGISKYNLAKGFVLYVLAGVIITVWANCIPHDGLPMFDKVRFICQIIPIIFFHLTNLVSLVGKRLLVKELCDELKDIEYQMWRNGINWSYKPLWCIKYIGFTVMIISDLLWETVYQRWKNIELRITHHLTYPALHSITGQYLALLQLCLSISRKVRTIEDSETVIKLTDKLSVLYEKVNTLYEVQLFTYILNIFIVMLVVIYVKIVQGEIIYIGTVCWMANYVSPLLMIVLCTGYISQEVKKINKMLYRRLLYNLDDEMLYFHLVAKREIVFTVYGFFNMKCTLIFSMITTGIDYLVFLIQYM